MKALTFCINGKMAHFRKYYSNSSVLSYLLPPVTTVKGILAGLLGSPGTAIMNCFQMRIVKWRFCWTSRREK